MKLMIVKRKGREERFDERKVYASCYAACLSSHMDKKMAEKISEKVTKHIKAWLKNRRSVTSNEVFRQLSKYLAKCDKDAAYMYRTHRDIS